MTCEETCVVERRYELVKGYLSKDYSMSELCLSAGISRKTGYNWVERYQCGGIGALSDRSRRPLHLAHAMDDVVREAILDLRHHRPTWGARKLKAWLERHHGDVSWPALSSIGALLKREGLTRRRRERLRVPPRTAPFRACCGPNDVWCIDFKGHFRTGDGKRCEPFTMTDGFSRYALTCRHVVRPRFEEVKPLMERAFRRHGLPLAIRSDNGAPFATFGTQGLSRLSVWWLKLGIEPERIAPGKPQENGRHERFHLTLKQETAAPPAASAAAQQRRMNRFCRIYNEERPHEALGLQVPADVYVPSPRPFPRVLPEVDYPAGFEVRRVKPRGQIKWQGETVYIGIALAAEPVGLKEVEGGWQVFFRNTRLGLVPYERQKGARYTSLVDLVDKPDALTTRLHKSAAATKKRPDK